MPTGQQLVIEEIVCGICSCILNEENREEEDNTTCDNCREQWLRCCDSCGQHGVEHSTSVAILTALGLNRWDYLNYSDNEGITLCVGCTVCCEECGEVYSSNDAATDCCYQEEEHDLHYYSWKPNFWFHSMREKKRWARPGVLYMGMEIEIERCSEYVREMAERTGEDWWEPNYFYFKSDGSLGTYGAELVTMPATMEAIKAIFPWEGLEWLHSQGARSFAYSSTGFHIHVSKSAFQPSHLYKFIKFQLKNVVLCERVAQRSQSHWASFENQDMIQARETMTKHYAKGERSNSVRYSALNFSPSETVELRYFKGNILPSAINRNIEFVQSIYDYTKQMTVRDYIQHKWSVQPYYDYVQQRKDIFPHLAAFLDDSNNQGGN
jgi:hypothetical protein